VERQAFQLPTSFRSGESLTWDSSSLVTWAVALLVRYSQGLAACPDWTRLCPRIPYGVPGIPAIPQCAFRNQGTLFPSQTDLGLNCSRSQRASSFDRNDGASPGLCRISRTCFALNAERAAVPGAHDRGSKETGIIARLSPILLPACLPPSRVVVEAKRPMSAMT
jgi:hypothetical protein